MFTCEHDIFLEDASGRVPLEKALCETNFKMRSCSSRFWITFSSMDMTKLAISPWIQRYMVLREDAEVSTESSTGMINHLAAHVQQPALRCSSATHKLKSRRPMLRISST
jgi:hypothetical protein